jgi:hypothetical protein
MPPRTTACGLSLRRSLDEASAEYAAALGRSAAPPDRSGAGLASAAPRVFVTSTTVACATSPWLHPTQPVIAYHFFWDDDIDYPDDNEPSDHEVVWVRYRPDGALDRLWTYFPGRILDGGEAAKQDAAAHDMRPAVMVQWGKHGSMPIGWEALSIEAEAGETESSYYPVGVPITLERYNQGTFRKLSTEGARAAGNPLAVRDGWPRTFTGSWEDFSRFDRPVDVLGRLQATSMVIVSRWNSASINQRFLRYNFRPKTEWPVEGW